MLHIKTDPIENTEEYKQAMKHIEPILEKEFEGKFMVSRPYWARKKARDRRKVCVNDGK